MGTLLQDVRYAVSMMVKKPGFAAVIIAALVLGIGANTAIFSVVNSVLLRPLPYQDADRIVRLHDEKPPELENFPVSPGNFTYWRNQTRSFEQIAAWYGGPPLIATGGDRPEQVDGARVSASLFPLLRVAPAMGRTFSREEEERGRDQVVILSHAMWQRRFGADRNVIGKTMTLSDNVYTVIGVMPREFQFPAETTELWVPLGFTAKDLTRHGSHFLSVLARLKPGVSIAAAQAEMSVHATNLARVNPETNGGWKVDVVSWQEDLAGPMRAPLLVLSGAVLFVLLIACANVTNLLLARAASRSREVAIRMTLGATRARVVRQLLTESVLLAVAGGLVGLVVAVAGVKALELIAPAALPAMASAGLDVRVLGFTLFVSILTGIVFGLAPAVHASRADLNSAMKEAARGTTAGPRRNRLRQLLVVAEVGLALVLLVGAGLLIRSFATLRGVDPGFNPKNVLTMNIALPKTRYEERPQQRAFFERLTRDVAALPGVESVAAASPLPLAGDLNYGFAIGQPTVDDSKLPIANYSVAGPDYFRVMGITLLKGRAFTDRDRADTPRVVIINRTLANKYFRGQDPIGRRLYITEGESELREIVGVVADVRQYGLDTEPTPQIYEPYLQARFYGMNLVIRTAGDPERITPAVLEVVSRLDKDQPVTAIRTMESVVGESLARQRFSTTLLTLFAAVALLLATMGIYAVMSYSVSERTHEIGIRVAIGAQASDILRLIVGQGAVLVMIGVAIGGTAAFGLTRLMVSLLFGVTATDAPTFVAVSALLVIVALLASYIPARRAAKLDPLIALRHE